MKRIAFVVLACVALLACKGSTATTEAAAPSASAATSPSVSAVTVASAPSASPSAAQSAAPSAAPSAGIVGSLRTPPAGACKCAHVKVGDVFPHQNGHAMQFHDRDAKVLSVDPSTCSATVKDIASGTTRTERCDSGFFDEPRINPAG